MPQFKNKNITLILTALIVILLGCTSPKHLNDYEVGDLRIRQYSHYGFYYLEIFDNERSLYFNYQVGDNKAIFTGGIGPIYEVSKRHKKSDKFYYLITRTTEDSACFLQHCYLKKGELTDLEITDKILLRRVDSFCRAKYAFYRSEIDNFKHWYLPK